MKRLGVNIDHIATLRNARGEQHPDPISAADLVRKLGADSITIHMVIANIHFHLVRQYSKED